MRSEVDDTYALIHEMCFPFRKGEEVTYENRDGIRVTHIYNMKPVSEAGDLLQVDMHFIVVGIRQWLLDDEHRARFDRTIAEYPLPDQLIGGPSYIEIGGVLDSQQVALEWMALGKAFGYWDIITPKTLGFEGADADAMAGSGLVMTSGIRGRSDA